MFIFLSYFDDSTVSDKIMELFILMPFLSLPCRLAILSNFPETTWPADYRSLLPELGSVNG